MAGTDLSPSQSPDLQQQQQEDDFDKAERAETNHLLLAFPSSVQAVAVISSSSRMQSDTHVMSSVDRARLLRKVVNYQSSHKKVEKRWARLKSGVRISVACVVHTFVLDEKLIHWQPTIVSREMC